MLLYELECDYESKNLVGKSNKNKILVVTHQKVMEALTASGVKYNEEKENSLFGPYDLVDG